jgi:ankyrin repeat protein
MKGSSEKNDDLGAESLTQVIALKNVKLISMLLARAITEENLEAIKRLVAGGADLNFELDGDMTPLDFAILKNRDTIKKLLEPYFTEAIKTDWAIKSVLLAPHMEKHSPRLSNSGFVDALHNTPSGSGSSTQAKQPARDKPPAEGAQNHSKCCIML